MTFRFRCVGKFVMATASRRKFFIRLFGLLVVASLFTSYLMYVRVNADFQGARVAQKQTKTDVNIATTSSVRTISERGEAVVESQQRIRSSSSPFLRGDTHLRTNREQAEGNGNVESLGQVNNFKKSRLTYIRRVFRDKRAHRTIHRLGNSSMNTPTDARKYSKNSRLFTGEALRNKNVGMQLNRAKTVTVASAGAGSIASNLSSAVLGSLRGDARRPVQNPLESKRVTVITKKPGSTQNDNSSSVPEYGTAKRTVQIGKQLEDGSITTVADIREPSSTPHENSSVIGDSLTVNNVGRKAILNKRMEDERVNISKTAMANAKKPEPAPHNNSHIIGDAFRHVIDARTNVRKRAMEPAAGAGAGAEKETSASQHVGAFGLGRLLAGIRRESVKQNLGQVDDDSYTPGNVTSSRVNLIIAAQPRTGSSFLGDAFNQHPDVFYLFEPLHGIVNSPLQHRKDPKPMQFLAGILQCKFSQLTYVKQIEKFRRFSSKALSSPPLCPKKIFVNSLRKKCDFLSKRNMEAVCKSNYNVTVMKILTSRMPNGTVKSLFPLCNSTNCTIIYLVRDPRPVVFSHMKVGIQSWQNFKIRGANDTAPRPSIKMYSAWVCQQIEANVNAFKNLTDWMKSRYHILRYEDLAGNPTETLRRVYKMAGLTLVNSTLEWIDLHTTGRKGSSKNDKEHYNYSTRRNSKAIIDNWRLEIDPCVVDIIEHNCRSVLKLLGYKPLNGSEQMQYNLNVSLIDGQ